MGLWWIVPLVWFEPLERLLWLYRCLDTLSGLFEAMVWALGAALLPLDWLHRLQMTW